jgi:predicted O-methyltransferase YrrM
MVRPFARHYDSIYADKDYESDIAVLSALCGNKSFSESRVLEIGAGTGSHTVRLASRVKELVSVEIDPDFAKLARQKVEAAACANVRLNSAPLEQLASGTFDGAAAFFHVLNYIAPANRLSFLEALSSRLRPGAWFVTDFWNGDAVMRDPPRRETRNKIHGTMAIQQTIAPTLDIPSNTVTLAYQLDIRDGDSSESFAEELKLYIWPLGDLEALLAKAGFADMQFWDCRKFPATATSDSWQVWMRAIRQ